MAPRVVIFTGIMLALGGLGGLAARALSLPLPFMIGSLAVGAALVMAAPGRVPAGYSFPGPLRMAVLSLIGVAIGGQVTPDLVARAGQYWISLAGMLVFVPLAHLAGYQLLSRIGGFGRAEAYFGAAPGGFIESITLAEEAGADIRIVTVQHFLRIILVILLVPTALTLYVGHPVGSSAGATMSSAPASARGLVLVAIVAAVGYGLGRRLHLPAQHLTGPLLCAAALSGSGLAVLQLPGPFVSAAQAVIGVSLGLRFYGMSLRMLLRGAGLTLIVVLAMGVIGLVLMLGIHRATGMAPEFLVLIYAPGGLTEMGLIALSLSGNSAVVVLHHVLRIIATVLMMNGFLRLTGFLQRP